MYLVSIIIILFYIIKFNLFKNAIEYVTYIYIYTNNRMFHSITTIKEKIYLLQKIACQWMWIIMKSRQVQMLILSKMQMKNMKVNMILMVWQKKNMQWLFNSNNMSNNIKINNNMIKWWMKNSMLNKCNINRCKDTVDNMMPINMCKI